MIVSPITATIIQNIHFNELTKGEALLEPLELWNVELETESRVAIYTVSCTALTSTVLLLTSAIALPRYRSVTVESATVSPASFFVIVIVVTSRSVSSTTRLSTFELSLNSEHSTLNSRCSFVATLRLVPQALPNRAVATKRTLVNFLNCIS